MPILHPESLSPDPGYGERRDIDGDGWGRFALHPTAICADGQTWLPRQRAAWQPCGINVDRLQHGELLLDFGTEIEAELELAVETGARGNVFITFGESEAEARGWGGYGQGEWCQVQPWHIPEAGQHRRRCQPVGFRFVRLQFHDCSTTPRIIDCAARAMAVGCEQLGDFSCPDDPLLQRLWQTSLYTARCCARPDDLWDGPKRDRLGWYGDARITQLALDAGFLLNEPAAAMIAKLPTDEWVNGIPNFSFDAVMMLRDLMLRHGVDVPRRAELVSLIDGMLGWATATQCNADGFIIKTDAALQFGHGFLDWSALPVGGRLEELGWLQCKFREALLAAAQIHGWLASDKVAGYRQQAEALGEKIRATFRCPGGINHTLRRIREGFEKYAPGWMEPSYAEDGPHLGPSGPSRHSTACAVFAGIQSDDMLNAGFDTTGQPDIITPMFLYYEMEARARLGDAGSAIGIMREWLADMVEPNDAATIWESFEPEQDDFRKWGLHGWPKSLCHGWGAGLVPLTQRWLLGIDILEPGFKRIRHQQPALDLSFTACIPTPQGIIHIEHEAGKESHIHCPSGVEVT